MQQNDEQVSSCQRALSIPELLEAILACAGMASLDRCKRVSRHWYRLIRDSRALQYSYYCTASAKHTYVEAEKDNDTEGMDWVERVKTRAADKYTSITWNSLLLDEASKKKTVSRNLWDVFSQPRKASMLWHQTLVCDPPAFSLYILCDCSTEELRTGGVLTLRDVYDKLHSEYNKLCSEDPNRAGRKPDRRLIMGDTKVIYYLHHYSVHMEYSDDVQEQCIKDEEECIKDEAESGKVERSVISAPRPTFHARRLSLPT